MGGKQSGNQAHQRHEVSRSHGGHKVKRIWEKSSPIYYDQDRQKQPITRDRTFPGSPGAPYGIHTVSIRPRKNELPGIIVIEKYLLRSEAFRQLNGTAKTVYFDFLMKCRVKTMKSKAGRKRERVILNNGELEYTYSEAEKRGLPRKRFMRGIDALVESGLIDIAHSGGGGWKGDKSLYAISERWRLFGTNDFIPAERSKDTRQGRGFQKGNDHWKKSSIIGVKNDNPTVVENDNPS